MPSWAAVPALTKDGQRPIDASGIDHLEAIAIRTPKMPGERNVGSQVFLRREWPKTLGIRGDRQERCCPSRALENLVGARLRRAKQRMIGVQLAFPKPLVDAVPNPSDGNQPWVGVGDLANVVVVTHHDQHVGARQLEAAHRDEHDLVAKFFAQRLAQLERGEEITGGRVDVSLGDGKRHLQWLLAPECLTADQRQQDVARELATEAGHVALTILHGTHGSHGR